MMGDTASSHVSAVYDRVMALKYGKWLALGTPSQVQSDPEVIRAYIGGDP